MTALAPVAPPTASTPRTKGTSGLVTAASTLFGLVFALSFYIYRKVTLAIFSAAAGVFKALRLAPVIRRAPTTFALLSVAGAIAAAPFADGIFAWQRPSRAALLGLGAYWLSSGVFMLASEVLCMPPGELARLREGLDRRFPERWFTRVLEHPIDAYFMRVTIHSTILAVPALLAFALRPAPSPLTALFCLLGQRVIARVHEAMDHGNIHNHVFRPRADAPPLAAAVCRAAGLYQEYPLNLAVGRIPGMYAIQHVAVHHAEDSSLDDNQTTVLRDRTSFLQYCATCTTWLLSRLFALDVAHYLFARRRTRLLRSLLLHVAGYYLFLGLVALASPATALLIFISHALPTPDTVITQYNWHGFVDTADFHNTYRNTIHVASTAELGFLGLNAHLHHHLHAACHWSEIANEARREEDRYRREGAAILRGSNRDRMLLVKLLFARDFAALAEEFSSIGDAPREDFARILEERTLPLFPRRWPAALVAFDRALGAAFAKVLL